MIPKLSFHASAFLSTVELGSRMKVSGSINSIITDPTLRTSFLSLSGSSLLFLMNDSPMLARDHQQRPCISEKGLTDFHSSVKVEKYCTAAECPVIVAKLPVQV